MSPKNQHIALMTALGWEECQTFDNGRVGGIPPDEKVHWVLPDLTLDLLHTAESYLLTDSADKHKYATLMGRHDYWSLLHACKEWKLECLLRTLNLWVEEKS